MNADSPGWSLVWFSFNIRYIKGNCSYVWYLQRRSVFGKPEGSIVLHSIKPYRRTCISKADELADFQIDTASPLECKCKSLLKGNGLTKHVTWVIFILHAPIISISYLILICICPELHRYIYYTGCLKMTGAHSKVNRKFISHLTRAKPTPLAAETVQVSHALPAVRSLVLTAGPVSEMASQQEKAFCVLRFEVSRSVITVQHARFRKDAPCMVRIF